jgi:hypothetical protein
MQRLATLSVVGALTAGALADVPAKATSTAAPPTIADTVREYRGLYESGFEVSWFHPCDAQPGDDLWWVTLTDAALHQRDSLATKLRGQQGAVFVRWRGTTSAKMQAGHMGRGTRYMLISEVLELRPSTDATCSTA